MKINIYYTNTVPAPGTEKRAGEFVGKDIDEKSLVYRLVWSGSDGELNFDYTDDQQAAKAVFYYLNRNEPEHFVGTFRSISIGDVVCLEDRCYLCQTLGWRRLEDFESQT